MKYSITLIILLTIVFTQNIYAQDFQSNSSELTSMSSEYDQESNNFEDLDDSDLYEDDDDLEMQKMEDSEDDNLDEVRNEDEDNHEVDTNKQKRWWQFWK